MQASSPAARVGVTIILQARVEKRERTRTRMEREDAQLNALRTCESIMDQAESK